VLHRIVLVTASVATGALLLAAPVAARVLLETDRTAPSAVQAPLPGATPCGPEPASAAGWENLFDSRSGAWAGADGAASVRLPDGQLLWLFGDTFVGAVAGDGTRAAGSRIVRNSVVVTDGSCVQPMPTTTDALPGRAGTWLWPSAGVVTVTGTPGRTSTVLVTAQRMQRTGPGAWGFQRVGMAVVTVVVPWRGTPSVGLVSDLAGRGTAWGAALVRTGATTWVYGSRERAGELGRDLMLARAPTATLADRRTWTYRTAEGWSRAERAAVPVRPASAGVSTVPSVVLVDGRWVVVTKAHEFLDPEVVALASAHPWGPWTTTPLFSAPSTDDVLRYSPAVVASSARGRLVVVVSRTSPSLALLRERAELAYPTFTDVPWGGR
jgi:hypothetical protein